LRDSLLLVEDAGLALLLRFEQVESIKAAGNSIRAIVVIPLLPSICQRNYHKS
jgi:hypothetical protein